MLQVLLGFCIKMRMHPMQNLHIQNNEQRVFQFEDVEGFNKREIRKEVVNQIAKRYFPHGNQKRVWATTRDWT